MYSFADGAGGGGMAQDLRKTQTSPQKVSDGKRSLSLIPVHCRLERYSLKVTRREIFDCSDFPDFYTIKSLPVGDLGVKIKKKFKNI
jgi:hypothetical protein